MDKAWFLYSRLNVLKTFGVDCGTAVLVVIVDGVDVDVVAAFALGVGVGVAVLVVTGGVAFLMLLMSQTYLKKCI